MLCSHFIIVCVYNGINEGKQFSLWLSLALCFCGVLCIVQAIDINFLFFVGSYFVAPYSIKRPSLNECLVSDRFLEEIQQLKMIYIYDVGDQYVNAEDIVI